MQIHDLNSGSRERRKRVGRGGKRGTYSGRGNKGQKARSGAHVNPLFEGGRSSLVERLKKVRGFKSPHPKSPFVKLSSIAKLFIAKETISVQALVSKGLLKKDFVYESIKIIGSDALPKGLVFDSSFLFSVGARNSIESSACSITEKTEA